MDGLLTHIKQLTLYTYTTDLYQLISIVRNFLSFQEAIHTTGWISFLCGYSEVSGLHVCVRLYVCLLHKSQKF